MLLYLFVVNVVMGYCYGVTPCVVGRYIAIVHPLHYSRYMTKLVTRLLMSATWTVAVCISCIPIFWNDWHEGVACEMNLVSSSDV